MGLTAGFKILDKDRDKSKEFDKDHDKPNQKLKEKEKGIEYKPHKLEEDSEGPPTGWTSMLEDFLCNGGTSSRNGSPSTAEIGLPRPLGRQKTVKEARKGPYQLLIKDRLMGIYMAVFIHRDLKPLVRGMESIVFFFWSFPFIFVAIRHVQVRCDRRTYWWPRWQQRRRWNQSRHRWHYLPFFECPSCRFIHFFLSFVALSLTQLSSS
jgi:hypothetical protein